MTPNDSETRAEAVLPLVAGFAGVVSTSCTRVAKLHDVSQRFLKTLAVLLAAVSLAGSFALPASGGPSQADMAADRAAVERAVAAYNAAQAHSADIDAQLAATSAKLDTAVAEETRARALLRDRVTGIYRSADSDVISILLEAATIQDFVNRWDLLVRIARQDARTLVALTAARIRAERAAKQLVDLQTQSLEALDATARQVAVSRRELGLSLAALQEYEARTVARAKPATVPKPDSTQKLTGSGAWKTAVASHYGRNFTGRSASGQQIGPYSMIVAHRTLPFGTLIEIEYNGKRAVAKVADRGPYTAGRDFDLGPGVVRVLDFSGVHEIRYRIISR